MLAMGRPRVFTPSLVQQRTFVVPLVRVGNVSSARTSLAMVGTCGRSLTVTVFSKKDQREEFGNSAHLSISTELQAYIDRERFLLSELAAARGQVDKLLDQQRVLIDMIARLSGLGIPAAPQPSTAMLSQPPLPPQRLAAPPASASPPFPATPTSLSPKTPISPQGSTSSDVPALTSLADLFKSAATAAPNPASAAAAASIAAAISAVDNGDILTINDFPAAAPPPPPPVSLPQPSLLFDTSGGFTTTSSAQSSSASASPAAAAADDDEAGGDLPVEISKAAPADAPPELVQGDDDIYWLSCLHKALEEKGYYPGDDDIENWFFGDGTLAAVMAFQATERLPETGVVDRTTWTALLGAELAEELYGKATAAAGTAATEVTVVVAASAEVAAASGSVAAAAATASASVFKVSSSSSSTSPGSGGNAQAGVPLNKWPVLMEGDGGREVHALQVALSNNGYHCGDDDMRWWQFGDSTLTALKFFQSCSHLPESGVCDERTWKALVGPDARPGDIFSLRLKAVASDEEDGGYEEDMDGASRGRVWLLGEQRWERRPTK